MATKKPTTERSKEVFYLQRNFYQVDERVQALLLASIDPDTGEVKNEMFLEYAQKSKDQRDEIVHSVVNEYLNVNTYASSIDAEIDRLSALKKRANNYAEYIKSQIAKVVKEGETMEFENVRISWRKSSSLEVDDFELMDLERLHEIDPLASVKKVEYRLDKKYLTQLIKDGLPLPTAGVKLVEKQNIQIK